MDFDEYMQKGMAFVDESQIEQPGDFLPMQPAEST